MEHCPPRVLHSAYRSGSPGPCALQPPCYPALFATSSFPYPILFFYRRVSQSRGSRCNVFRHHLPVGRFNFFFFFFAWDSAWVTPCSQGIVAIVQASCWFPVQVGHGTRPALQPKVISKEHLKAFALRFRELFLREDFAAYWAAQILAMQMWLVLHLGTPVWIGVKNYVPCLAKYWADRALDTLLLNKLWI